MQHPPRAYDAATDALVRTTMLAGLVPALVVGLVLLLLVHPLVGLAAAVVVVVAWAALVRSRAAGAADRLLAPLDARDPSPGGEPRLENLIEGVAVVSGIEEPRVRLLSDTSLNALAVADVGGATFVLTRGLLDELGRVELEGVLANLAARVKSGAARYATTVLALPLPAAFAARLLDDAFGDQASVRADLDAVGLTRYPPGLIRALGTMAEQGTGVAAASALPPSAPLWLADPSGAGEARPTAGAGGPSPQPLPLRIAVLEEL